MELVEIEEQLEKIMTDEISLFSLYREDFIKMKKDVEEKDWVSLQSSIESLKSLSGKISEKDELRDSIYKSLCLHTNSTPEDSFYSVISQAYGAAGHELYDIFRMIKNEARSLKALNKNFNQFILNRKNLVNDIMEEFVPELKGTIYNRRGITFHENSSSSLVLNKHL